MNFRTFHIGIIAAILVVYLFSAKGYLEVVDTLFSVDTALSLYDHGSLEIQRDGEGTHVASDGRKFSKYGIGLPTSYLPYIAIGTGLSHVAKLPRMDVIGFILSFSNIPFAIATLLLFSQLLRKFEISEKTICFLTAALGLGTLCWRYACYDFSEEIQMTLLTLSVYGVIRPKRKDILWGGIGFSVLLLFKLIHILLLPFFGLYLLTLFPTASARLKALAHFGLPVILSLAFLGGMNAIRFGSPFETGYGSEAEKFYLAQMAPAIAALIFSLNKGLLIYCPILILGIAGVWAFLRKHPSEASLCGGLIVMNLFWAGAWSGWDGGWAWGPRLLVPSLPLWLLPAAFLIDAPHRQRWFPAWMALLAFSILWQIPGVVIKDQEIHYLRQRMFGPVAYKGVPPDTETVCILLFHKLSHAPEVYRLADLSNDPGVSGGVIDLTSFHTFAGYNIWTEQARRQFHHPALRWLVLLGVVAVPAILAYSMHFSSTSSTSTQNFSRDARGRVD